MSAETPRRALAMTLPELIARYKKAAAKFGDPVPFASFGVSPEEIARVFSAYDEDYHISRFFRFSKQDGQPISINGVPATHVSLDPAIQSIL